MTDHAHQKAGGGLCEQNLVCCCVPGKQKLGRTRVRPFLTGSPTSDVLARKGKALFSDSDLVAANKLRGSGPCTGSASDVGT